MPPNPRATAEGIVEYVAGASGSVILEHERELWLDRIAAALEARDRELAGRVERLRQSLLWIAQQGCEATAPGATEDTPCSETGACITEYCLPCWAEAHLNDDDRRQRPPEGGGDGD